MLQPSLFAHIVPFCKGFLPVVQDLSPGLMRSVPSWEDWDHVPDLSAKYDHGRGHLGDGVDGVPVVEDGLLEPVNVKAPRWTAVTGDCSLHGLNP